MNVQQGSISGRRGAGGGLGKGGRGITESPDLKNIGFVDEREPLMWRWFACATSVHGGKQEVEQGGTTEWEAAEPGARNKPPTFHPGRRVRLE